MPPLFPPVPPRSGVEIPASWNAAALTVKAGKQRAKGGGGGGGQREGGDRKKGSGRLPPPPALERSSSPASPAVMALGVACAGFYTGLLFSLLELWFIEGLSLEPIYWNTSNKKFQSEEGYVLYPQIGDRLDLICPRSVPLGPFSTEDYEYYKLYLVQTEQAERCEILRTPNLLLTCDRPEHDMRFTIKFQEYSPNLWGHEFKTKQDYYIITTSDGTKEGLENMKGGACLSKGMKVVLKVGQNPGTGSKSQKSVPDTPAEKERGTPGAAEPNKEVNAGSPSGNTTGKVGGENGPLPQSNVPIIAGAAGGAAFVLLVAAAVTGTLCYRRRRAKHSESHHPPLSLSTLTSPKRGGGGSSGGNNNGSEPSDIIIPLRTSDSAFCPHYEKVSGDYGHPVYIVQEMPPQSPANIYYKV